MHDSAVITSQRWIRPNWRWISKKRGIVGWHRSSCGCIAHELEPHDGTNHLRPQSHHGNHNWHGAGEGRRTWLKQAGLHRKVQLYPEGTNVLLHIILRKIHILAVCAKLTKCAPRTSNHVQQYIVLGVAALASMLLQIFLLKKSQRIYSVGWFIESRSNVIASLYTEEIQSNRVANI